MPIFRSRIFLSNFQSIKLYDFVIPFRLCDLKSLTNKRTAPTAVAPKLNGVVEPKKPTKKAAKEDEMAKFLANSDDTDKPIESDDEKSDREEITEEQFLKEQNRMLKEQLLEDSDSELDSDSERPINGMCETIVPQQST